MCNANLVFTAAIQAWTGVWIENPQRSLFPLLTYSRMSQSSKYFYALLYFTNIFFHHKSSLDIWPLAIPSQAKSNSLVFCFLVLLVIYLVQGLLNTNRWTEHWRQNFDFLTNLKSWYVVKNLIFLSQPFCFWIFFFISMKISRQLLASKDGSKFDYPGFQPKTNFWDEFIFTRTLIFWKIFYLTSVS